MHGRMIMLPELLEMIGATRMPHHTVLCQASPALVLLHAPSDWVVWALTRPVLIHMQPGSQTATGQNTASSA